MYQKRICKLRELMKKEGLDYFLFANADGHFSEYVCDYYKKRTAFSGFTGSNGTLLIGLDSAFLWTDGRYFIQAERELSGTGITLMKSGTKNVPTISEYLRRAATQDIVLGLDAEYASYRMLKQFRENFSAQIRVKIMKDLPETALEKSDSGIERKLCPSGPVIVLPDVYLDYSVRQRIEDIREEMRRKKHGAFFSNKLDTNMWIMGIRGTDIEYNPYAYSYVLITENDAYLFVKPEAVTDSLVMHCTKNSITIKEYASVISVLSEKCSGFKTAASFAELNGYIADCCNNRGVFWADDDCGTGLMQAIKSEAETEAIRDIYIRDSVAVCKFLYWLSEQPSGYVTEYDAACRMNDLRKDIPGFLDLSFETISAYGANAAMMHYAPEKERPVKIVNGNVFLLDSGGQYNGGTTDVTRTVAIGEVSDEVKSDYTAVIRGMLALQNAHFLYGCTGMNLDILARTPIWEKNLDYKCGTGHGIGFMLGVHEGPQAIRTKGTPPASETPFMQGMLVSDEPGIYKEGKYGIRVENVLLCKEACRSGEDVFMEFEPLTYVPLDPNLILAQELSAREKQWILAYHNQVCDKMRPYLNDDEFAWLLKQKIY